MTIEMLLAVDVTVILCIYVTTLTDPNIW